MKYSSHIHGRYGVKLQALFPSPAKGHFLLNNEMSQRISCRLVSLNDVALIFRHKAKLHGALENLKAWVFFSRGKRHAGDVDAWWSVDLCVFDRIVFSVDIA